VRIGKNLWEMSYPELPQTRGCFITMSSTLLCNTPLGGYKRARKGWIERDTPAFGLTSWCQYSGRKHRYHKENTEALLDDSKKVGAVVNPEKTEYMLISRSQKIGQKHSIKRANRYYENVANFKWLGTTLVDQNCTLEEIKSGTNSGKVC
jgi:hypothetical protein